MPPAPRSYDICRPAPLFGLTHHRDHLCPQVWPPHGEFRMTRPLGQAGLLALAALWLGVWPAASEPQRPLFPADQEACFSRVYDAAHLRSHPRQKAARVFVMRELGRRREAEDWTP